MRFTTPARRTLLLSLALAPLAACGATRGSDPSAGGSASDGGGAASDAGGAAPGMDDSPSAAGTGSGEAPVTLEDSWAKSAGAGEMSAAFGVLTSTGTQDLVLIGATSPASAEVQLHEMTSDGTGGMSMTQKEGGFALPAGESLAFEPGGNHLMFMSLAEPLLAGDTIQVTLQFEGDVEATFEIGIRDFAGADESYTEGASDGGGMDHEGMDDGDMDGEGMDHEGDDR